MKRHWKFIVVLIAGVISLFFEFGIHASTLFTTPLLKLQMNPQAIIIDILGIWISVLLLMEIFEDWKSGRYGVDILAVIAIVSTILINNYWAEWMILVMSTGGETLEDYATGQASKELRSLLNNTPRIANKLINGQITEVKVDELHIGDIVLIKPGQQVPVDGEIVKGTSSFDQSSLTGESVPVTKKPGDNLMSGSVNGDAAVQMKVTKEAKDSEYQSIVALVKSSQAQPAKFVKMADRYAVPFTIISLIIGAVAWAVSGDATRFAEVMVVASPCPLLIAAPVALVSGMSSMSAHHIIVKSGPTLEKLARAKTFAFDKTGTLTYGHMQIVKIITNQDYPENMALLFAASLEQKSSHPLAKAFINKAMTKNLFAVENYGFKEGLGVYGEIISERYAVGNLKYAKALGIEISKDNLHIYDEYTAKGYTVLFLYKGQEILALFVIGDEIKAEAKFTIDALHTRALKTLMLTGDTEKVALNVANLVNIEEVKAGLLPQDKAKIISNLNAASEQTVMVGDGINDSVSLTQAHTGIGLAGTSDIAVSACDVVLLRENLLDIVNAYEISKKTIRIIKENLFWAFIYNIVFIPVAAGVF